MTKLFISLSFFLFPNSHRIPSIPHLFHSTLYIALESLSRECPYEDQRMKRSSSGILPVPDYQLKGKKRGGKKRNTRFYLKMIQLVSVLILENGCKGLAIV